MERFIQLNLQNDSSRAEADNSSRPESKSPAVTGKTLNLMANRAAHKPASNFARSTSGIFTK